MIWKRSTFSGRTLLCIALTLFVWAVESTLVVPVLRGESATLNLIAWALVFDCTVVPASLYYFLLARRSLLALLPVIAIGLIVATVLLPPEHRAPTRYLRFLVAPAELAVLGMALWRLGKALRRPAGSQAAAIVKGDAFDKRLEIALGENASPALRLIAAELVLWHYAVIGTRLPTPAEDDTTFGVAEDVRSLVPALILISVLEGIAEHFLVWQWSPRADIALLAFSAYGVVCIAAEINALRLRPIRLADDLLEIQTGLRWRIDVPYAEITDVRQVLSHARRKPVGYINAVSFGAPNLRLHLDRAVTARGLFGIRRKACYIALKVDRPDQFRAVLMRRLPSSEYRVSSPDCV